MPIKDKIKVLLFNPVVFVLLFISVFIAFNSTNPDVHKHWITLFLLVVFYPVFWEMSDRSFLANLGTAFLFFLVLCYMFFGI